MKSQQYSEIPSWFAIENYRALNKLSEEGLIRQLEFRIELINSYKFHTSGNSAQTVSIEDFLYPGELERWNHIVSGNPVIKTNWDTETPEYEEKVPSHHLEQNSLTREEVALRQSIANWSNYEKTNNSRLPATASFSGLNTFNLLNLYEKLKRADILNESYPLAGIKDEHFLADINLALNNKAKQIDSTSTIYLALRLGKRTDKEILEDLKKLLPLWRNQLGIPPPQKKSASPVLFKKVKPYNIVPYFDLLIWQLFSNCKITYAEQAVALEVKDDDRLKQTIIRNADKILQFYEADLADKAHEN